MRLRVDHYQLFETVKILAEPSDVSVTNRLIAVEQQAIVPSRNELVLPYLQQVLREWIIEHLEKSPDVLSASLQKARLVANEERVALLPGELLLERDDRWVAFWQFPRIETMIEKANLAH